MIDTPPGPYQGPNYYIGLDLGQAGDPSALVILERSSQVRRPDYSIVYIKRWPLRTEYADIVRATAQRVSHPNLRPLSEMADTFPVGAPRAPLPVLVIDATGVGRAIVELFARENLPAAFRPMVITGGAESTEAWWGDERGTMAYRTPKQELVGTLQALLGTGRLKVPRHLDQADTLRQELRDFRVHVTKAAHETYAAREGRHDDLVLAAAMPLWVAEQPVHTCQWGPDPTAPGYQAERQATKTRGGLALPWR